MDGEATTYARELQWVLGQLCVALRGLSAAQLNWRIRHAGVHLGELRLTRDLALRNA
jgi:hypothetical protein